jgi:hypothetical protein
MLLILIHAIITLVQLVRFNSFSSISHYLLDTTCRVTRTIQSIPYAIDTNQTSFIGINILDSANCVESSSMVNISIPTECSSLQKYAPLGPYCEVLGRTFNEKYGDYAVFADTSNFDPTSFSFDFIVREPIVDGLILLYGRNTPPINDYFWIAIEIDQLKLRFQFRDIILEVANVTLNTLKWYHVDYQVSLEDKINYFKYIFIVCRCENICFD